MTGGPIFLVGAYRSGTTLLRLMFNQHSRVGIPPESHFLVDLPRKLEGRFDPATVRAALSEHPRAAEYGLDETLLAQLDSVPDPGFASWFDFLAREVVAREGKVRWGDKTPEYVRHLEVLDEMFPACQVIHLVRDGRDVACSLLGVPWFEGGVDKAARRWRKRVSRGRQEGAKLGPERYRELRYEDLVQDPEGRLRELCEFVGEPFEPAMLEYHRRAHEQIPEDRRAWHGNTARPPQTTRVERWRQDLPDEDVRTFERIAGKLLQELGYPLSTQPSLLRRAWWRCQRH